MNTTSLLRTLSPLALLMIASAAIAGPLTPAAGPVGSTMKTMTEVEPRIAINQANTPGDADGTPSMFKITQPGSYYLTGNITGVAGKNGIEIAAAGVTIDLNGFSLSGGPGSLDGVLAPGGTASIVIRNGTIASWGGDGIDVLNSVTGRIEGVVATRNVGIGIKVGESSLVIACTSTANEGDGINATDACTITGCSTFENLGSGIITGQGCTVVNCSSMKNSARGIVVNSGSTVQGVSARFNGSDGISCVSSCIILNNNLSGNGTAISNGAGIYVTGSDNRIEGNNSTGADIGLDVDGSGNFIVRNICSGNGINWSIAAGNAVAPIVNASTNAAGINGNSYTGSLGSTDPNANFTY